MPTIELIDGGEVVGVLQVSGNDVATADFEDDDLRQTFSELDGMTGFESRPPKGRETTHVDELVPMEEEQVVANVRMVAGANALEVNVA